MNVQATRSRRLTSLMKAVLASDVLMVTLIIFLVTTLTCLLWFFLAWLVYEERYNVGLI